MSLVTLRPGLTLAPEAAASWARMEAARGSRLDVNSSFRDPVEQQKARDAYLAWIAYQNGGPVAPWAPLALDPSKSWHCLGLAVDTDDDAWLRANPDHGWRFVVSTEKWHAQYYASLDKYRSQGFPAGSIISPADTDPVPVTAPILEEPMSKPIAYVKGDTDPAVYAVYLDAGANNPQAPTQGGVYCARRYVTAGELRIAKSNGFELQTIPQKELDALPKVFGSR